MRKILCISAIAVLIMASASAQKTGTQKKIEWNIGHLDRVITVENPGNLSSTSVSTAVPRYMSPLITYSEKPDNQRKSFLLKTVSWDAETESGEKVKYTVSFSYWPIIGAAFIFILAGYGVRKYRHRKLIRKTVRNKTENVARIDIHLDNRGRELEEVVVEDFLPSGLEINQILTGKPETEETDIGTRIKWQIDSLGKKDQRVLSYTAKSTEEVKAVFEIPGTEILTEDHNITRTPEHEIELEPSDREST